MSKLQDENQINIQLPTTNYSPIPQKQEISRLSAFKSVVESILIPQGEISGISQSILLNAFLPAFIMSIWGYLSILLKLILIALIFSLLWLIWHQFPDLRLFLAFRVFIASVGLLLGYA